MKLLTIIHDNAEYTYYDINSPLKFKNIRFQLRCCFNEILKHAPMINHNVEDHINILEQPLKNKSDKFKLFIILKEKELVSFAAIFITEEAAIPTCLIYAAYFDPGLVNTLFEDMLKFIDVFASHNSCKRISFITERDEKAFERLLRKYNFRPTRVIFERELATA